ncbi:MAG: T9SS type A sorting domain-containing protein [Bacteroidetes bacterium]|nr:T9SS type A sorting domain-containing protein [Bacteroidota bacterium]
MNKVWVLLVIILTTPIYGSGQIIQKGAPDLALEKQIEIPTTILPKIDIKKLEREDRQSNRSRLKILRYAEIIDVDLSPETDGIWVDGKNGEKIWYLKIISSDAYSLGILFDQFRLPVGSKLFVYSSDHKYVRGAFTYKNNKASNILPIAPVKGDEIIIEYHEPAKVEFNGELHISSVAHDYKNIFNYLSKSEKGYGDSGSCNVNINCDNTEMWQLLKHSVCKILVGGQLCSGALINNTANNGKPYLLTANHCLIYPDVEQDAIFYFNYESPGCENQNIIDDQTISGATLIATPPERTIDFSLLELSTAPPPEYKPYYAGWNRDIKDPESVTSIHHPRGDIKKITKSYDGATTGFYDYNEGYDEYKHWYIDAWDEGTTEGGSSGSPLLDQNGKIIGDLTGGDASCNYNFNDYYQQLYHSWQDFDTPEEQLKPWLDPINSELVELDGFLPFDTIPTHLQAHLVDTLAYLDWNEVIDTANIDFYYIYRNDSIIDSLKASSYIDTLTNIPKTYRYFITAKYNTPQTFESLPSNNAYVRTFNISTLPFFETFENPVDIYDYWYEERSNDTVGWEIKTGGFPSELDTAFEGSLNGYFFNNNGETSKWVMPVFDLSAYEHVNLSFYLHIQELNNDFHHLNILYKEADTLNWKIARAFTNNTTGWTKKTVSLPNLSSNYQIAFEGIGLRGFGISVDSILIQEDDKFIQPEFSINKDTICLNDSILFSAAISKSNSVYWNFGISAIPREAYGAGPHWVKYFTPGIKSLELILNDTYRAYYPDVAVAYKFPDKPSIVVSGNTLISSINIGNQWYLNGNPIEGETNKTYTIEDDGNYFVEVSNGFGCSQTSESLNLIVSGTEEWTEINSEKPNIQIFPNPNTGRFNVQINNEEKDRYYYKIINITGHEIMSGTIKNSNQNQEINIENATEGVYLIQIFNAKENYTAKLLIKK